MKGVHRTFQNGGLFPELTVLENVLAGLHVQIESSFLGIVFGTRAAREAEREGLAPARRRLLGLMDLGDLADQPVKDPVRRPAAHGGDRPHPGHGPAAAAARRARGRPFSADAGPHDGHHPALAGEEGIGIMLIEHVIDLVMAGSDVIVVLSSAR